jgi:hypothetical protein
LVYIRGLHHGFLSAFAAAVPPAVHIGTGRDFNNLNFFSVRAVLTRERGSGLVINTDDVDFLFAAGSSSARAFRNLEEKKEKKISACRFLIFNLFKLISINTYQFFCLWFWSWFWSWFRRFNLHIYGNILGHSGVLCWPGRWRKVERGRGIRSSSSSASRSIGISVSSRGGSSRGSSRRLLSVVGGASREVVGERGQGVVWKKAGIKSLVLILEVRLIDIRRRMGWYLGEESGLQ